MCKSSTKKIFFLMIGLSLLSVQAALAQFTVRGEVTDTGGEPLIGVNVLIKGSGTGAITEIDGSYELVASESDTLVFSYIGYRTEEVPVVQGTNINVVLMEDAQALDEVVVVGYGTMRKSDVAGSIISVDDEALTDVKVGNVFEALQGRVAGVDITRSNGRAGAGIGIQVRGERSLSATNSPLILVDGVPYGSNIDIDQSDIESIEILKDAASTAIYGSRGANGVILITTKRGKAGTSKITFNTYYGVSEPFQEVPVYDRAGYIQASIDATKDINNWEMEPNPFNVFPGDELAGFENGTSTNWQDLVTRTGAQQNYNLGFEGGNAKTQYSTSLNYFDESGVVERDEFSRITARVNLDSKLSDVISVGTSTILSYRYRDGRGPRFTDAVLLSPIVPAFDSTGTYIFQPNFANPRKSPLAQLLDEEESRETRIFSTVYGGLDLGGGFQFRTNLNFDVSSRRGGYMYPQKVPTEGFTTSGASNDTNYGYLWNNILSFNRDFGKHYLMVTAVHEMQYDRTELYTIDGQMQQFDRSLWYNLSTNQDPQVGSSLVEQSLLSFLGRINYTFNDKYILSLSGRFDGASQLSDGNKWDFFPAASVAWRVSEEPFMEAFSPVSDLKLRLSYGVTGNAAISPYSTAAALNVDPFFYEFGTPGSEAAAFAFRPEALASIDLQWERTAQFNVGFDFGILENRIYGSFDYFRSNTDRLLLPDRLPPTTGFDAIFANAGKTASRGWEVYVHTRNVDSRDFNWSSDISVFRSQQEIVELASGQLQDEGNGWFVGQPINVHYDFRKLGIWQFGEEDDPTFTGPGEIRVEDVNGDGVINFDDRVILGTPQPEWSGSFVNTFTFKGVDLSVNIFARMGQMIDAGAYSYDPRMYDNMVAVDYWTPENPTNEYPRYDATRAELPFEQTLRYRDGSYIKIKNITLGYSFPKTMIDRLPMSSLRVYASARNPFILHSELFDGLDPERNGSISWPLARLWLFGLDVSF
jgi:TonB-dependent starch-binding outer membrane protein SusC